MQQIKNLGLYSRKEHDACGIGFMANINDEASYDVVNFGLKILENLDHRGAVGADPKMGDGCGILLQIPDKLFRKEFEKNQIILPPKNQYGIMTLFMPDSPNVVEKIKIVISRIIDEQSFKIINWREVPINNAILGQGVKQTEPYQIQLFIVYKEDNLDLNTLERKLFITRKIISNEIFNSNIDQKDDFYIVSSSCKVVIYKGLMLANQLGLYYLDLQNPDFQSSLALVHQRFATNTFPSWRLAHPYRMIAHNGEINTLRGNVNWMAARQASVKSEKYGEQISQLWPISYEGQSDTACLDNALEFLVHGGYTLPHAMMMLIPEAWSGNDVMDSKRKSFYEYNASLMEPWDGPATIAFTDGRMIGATLDRNGLRPARYFVTDDNMIVMASEMGVLPIEEERIISKWRLEPGKMLLVNLDEKRIISDAEIKNDISSKYPYKEWLDKSQIILEDLPPVEPRETRTDVKLIEKQIAFGYTIEDLNLLMKPMADTGQEAVGSMGTDTPISVLSKKSKSLFTYFKQNFAQVTNPPIDPIREELVMSLVSFIGPRPNIFDFEGNSKKKRLEVRQPILTNQDLEKIRCIGHIEESFDAKTLDITFPINDKKLGLRVLLEKLCQRAVLTVNKGFNIIILSDRLVGPDRVAIPSLLATSAVHHYLIKKGLRTSVGLVVETGDAREVHHFALLAGYGAEAINPYLAFDTIVNMPNNTNDTHDSDQAIKRFIKAIDKGLLKVMSKMGISTFQSYCGAQIFDAIGLSENFVDEYFTGTNSPIGGIGLEEIFEEIFYHHTHAFSVKSINHKDIEIGGDYSYRIRGEAHSWTPQSVSLLQHSVRMNSREKYQDYANYLNDTKNNLQNIRGLLDIDFVHAFNPIDLEEVESAKSIVKRFSTGAMSFGSISREAHTTLAIAMNRIEGRSNTGEGGEESDRFKKLPNGDSMRSAIKQVASGRFGVTTEYLVNSDVIQIKMAQGAKPGEGGQLPGHKVDSIIAKVRHSTKGVGLISPPPHHDIYSIEDLAQLIFDLKNVNSEALISVKLVSETGVGTIAAGVAKAKADHITISGFEGGTGASPLTSIKHSGLPWEIGLAETHQTLVLNKLRSRVIVQVDGGLRTGRDVLIAAMLGADEFGFATAPLIAAGCIMMRKCHLNTCPVGIATQDPILRKKFVGLPEHVINFFFFVAEEIRSYMAKLGIKKFDELIGQTQFLKQIDLGAEKKYKGINLDRLLFKQAHSSKNELYHCENQNHKIAEILDKKIIEEAHDALTFSKPVIIEKLIRNSDRSIGTMLSGTIAKKYGLEGLPHHTISLNLEGTAGQSFGAWLMTGVTLNLQGQANDYVGKGLSGGKIIIRKDIKSKKLIAHENVIIGNTALYGAIMGECYVCGVAGERFAVRNSGALAVVEGIGDHGCEYMTGGIVVVLGKTGRNFAAGMSGGIAYVFDEDNLFPSRCNLSMVELEPIIEEEEKNQLRHQFGDLDSHGLVDIQSNLGKYDSERLLQIIKKHYEYTGSHKAEQIIENWQISLTKFKKVMPIDYRNALLETHKSNSLKVEAN